jgi:hypothetical protein
MAFLRLGSVMQDVGRDDFAVQAVANARGARTRQLFHLNHRIQLVRVRATIGFGHGGAQKPILAGFVPHLARHIALLFPRIMKRRDFFVDKAAEAVAEGFVVRGEKGSFDHGGCSQLGVLISQSNCLVK